MASRLPSAAASRPLEPATLAVHRRPPPPRARGAAQRLAGLRLRLPRRRRARIRARAATRPGRRSRTHSARSRAARPSPLAPGWRPLPRSLERLPPAAASSIARSAYVEVAPPARRTRGGGSPHGRASRSARRQPRSLGALDGADMLWLDAISNPALDVPELDRPRGGAPARPAPLVVDATLATPVLVRPLELGADLVLHSATKYIGGHSDLLLGVAAARDPRARRPASRRARHARSRARARWRPGSPSAGCGRSRCASSAAGDERRAARRAPRRPPGRRAASAIPASPSDPSHAAATRLFDGFGRGALASSSPAGRPRRRVCERVAPRSPTPRASAASRR